MVRGVATRGLGLFDVLVALAVLALIVYVVRLDWPPRPGAAPSATPSTTAAR